MYKNVYKDDAMKKEQHMAVRNTAGWYLYTHQLMEVKGEDATAFLDYLYANPIGNLSITRARYTTMLNEEGQILDDVVIFRMEENLYWVSTLYVRKLKAWFDAHKGDYKVEYRDITKEWDMYAVQGPKSLEMLNAMVEVPVENKFFQILDNKIDGIPVKINKGGFTGEKLGYEIYVAPEHTKEIIAKLRAVSPAYDAKQVTEIQVMVWTLPTEKGYYLMCDIGWTNPFEVGLDWGIKWEKKDFLGKEALLKIKEEGAKRTLFGFTVDEDDVFIPGRNLGGPGAAVIKDGEEIGRVTKMTYSYCLDKNIGYVLVDNSKAKIGDKVLLHGYEAVLTDKVIVP